MEKQWIWDEFQREVIESPPEKRILVDAGPGTGKTAVACGRVAWLIKNGMYGDKIWLISFTRTAVQEIRNRIKNFLNDGDSAYAVRIATLDSHAWKIHSGFDGGAELLGTYNENIEKLTKMIREDKNQEISDYLETVEHLIVDEAQDIVGIRADLVLEIIGKLSDNCGITVFSDEAQAIYGFSVDEETIEMEKNHKTLPEKIREKIGNKIYTCQLKKVFRTDSLTLNELYTATRHKVLTSSDIPLKKLNDIRTEILDLADEKDIPRIDKRKENYPEDCFILYRRRDEVLLAASFLGKIQHRIRMSGLPNCIHPWVGICLSEHIEKTLSKKDFMEFWNHGVEGTPFMKDINPTSAWDQLVRLAGKTNFVVDMNLLRRRLGQEKPPAEICSLEIGRYGPIIGTIHASKGREANNIYLMLPANKNRNGDKYTDYDEETRVVFVGATRARNFLGVGEGYKYHFSSKLEPSGRVFKKKNGGAMVEIGRDGDINAAGIAGRIYYKDADIVRSNQNRLYSLADGITIASATSDHSCDHVYRITPEGENKDIAVISGKGLKNDLFQIGDRIGGNNRPPEKLTHLRIYGIRTIVLPPDSPECNNLYEPWARSGIMLAPVVLGYTLSYFPSYIRRT